MELTKSFVLLADELAWLLSGRALPACPPVEALAAAPFEAAAVRDRLAGKGILQRTGGGEGVTGVVAFLMRSIAAAQAWIRLEDPPALLLQAPRLCLVLTPYVLCPGAWRITPCPTLADACALLERPAGMVELGRAGEAPVRHPAPEGPIYPWLEEQRWS